MQKISVFLAFDSYYISIFFLNVQLTKKF